MANSAPSTSSPLKENIFFLTIGSFTSSICILLFDHRLYTAGDIFLLFIAILLSFIVQAFAGSMKNFITTTAALILYARSLAINFIILSLFYFFLISFSSLEEYLLNDLLLTTSFSRRLCLLLLIICSITRSALASTGPACPGWVPK